jgi:hypothetical protein
MAVVIDGIDAIVGHSGIILATLHPGSFGFARIPRLPPGTTGNL